MLKKIDEIVNKQDKQIDAMIDNHKAILQSNFESDKKRLQKIDDDLKILMNEVKEKKNEMKKRGYSVKF